MGKAGRMACIFTPMVLTFASLICLVLIEVSGWGKGTLPSYYFMKANFTDLSVGSSDSLDPTSTLATALNEIKNDLDDVYYIHLWNYCTSDSVDGSVDYCAPRKSQFVFDPVSVWHLNDTSTASNIPSGSSNVAQNEIDQLTSQTKELEDQFFGEAGRKALDAYRKVAKIMFILYAVSFWTTLATIVIGVFAIFSRWGSLCTWILALLSSIVNTAAVITSTAMFGALVGALKTAIDQYGVEVSLGKHALIVTWLSVVFSWAATLFWLFSICCCSGRSNPHHRSNKGGLWNAEPKGQDYYGRGTRGEKTGGYERVGSPSMGQSVPLTQYPQQTGYVQGGYEPFRPR